MWRWFERWSVGDLTDAKTVAAMIREPSDLGAEVSYKASAYLAIAVVQARDGDATAARESFSLAVTHAGKPTDLLTKVQSYPVIAEEQMAAGDPAAAEDSRVS